MKCGNTTCDTEAPEGRYYCSKICARVDADRRHGQSTTRSGFLKEQSYSREDGEPSDQSLPDERPTLTQPEESQSVSQSESPPESTGYETRSELLPKIELLEEPGPTNEEELTPPEKLSGPSEIESDIESSGSPGTTAIETSKIARKLSEEYEETQATDLPISQTRLNEAMSVTMSTIDESATLLLDCMHSAARKNEKGEAQVRDFRDLNAICNAGKQIAQLAKVKLDAIKEARK